MPEFIQKLISLGFEELATQKEWRIFDTHKKWLGLHRPIDSGYLRVEIYDLKISIFSKPMKQLVYETADISKASEFVQRYIEYQEAEAIIES